MFPSNKNRKSRLRPKGEAENPAVTIPVGAIPAKNINAVITQIKMDQIDKFLSDITDPFWKERIKNSVLSVFIMYDLPIEEKYLSREVISSTNLFVAAVEECQI